MADLITRTMPAKYRRWVYALLAAAFAAEAVLDVIPAGTEEQIVAVLASLGFAVANRMTADIPAPPAAWPAPSINEPTR